MCVFCDEPFPQFPSDQLIQMGLVLKRNPNAKKSLSSYPCALHLPVSMPVLTNIVLHKIG